MSRFFSKATTFSRAFSRIVLQAIRRPRITSNLGRRCQKFSDSARIKFRRNAEGHRHLIYPVRHNHINLTHRIHRALLIRPTSTYLQNPTMIIRVRITIRVNVPRRAQFTRTGPTSCTSRGTYSPHQRTSRQHSRQHKRRHLIRRQQMAFRHNHTSATTRKVTMRMR